LYVTFYYLGGSAGAALTGAVWRKSGWTGCVGLFCAATVLTLVLGLIGGRSVRGRPEAAPALLDGAV